MSNVYRDRRWLVCACLGILVTAPALVLWLKDRQPPSWTVPTTLLGLVLILGGCFLHDRSHRRRGTAAHAVTGNPFRR